MKEIKKQLDRIENKVDETLKAVTRTDPIRGKFVTCMNCKYTWRTISESRLVSCPKCSKKTKVETDEEIVKRVAKEITEENKKYPSNLKDKLGIV